MAESEQKPTKPLTERKIKALEAYLGIIFEPDDDDVNPYDEYHEKDYGLGADVKALKKKAFPNKEEKRRFWR